MRLLAALILFPVAIFAATESVSIDTKTKKVQNPLVKFGSGNTLDCTGAVVTNCGSSGGSVAWGSITGTLSAQTDLQSVLDAKVPTSRTISTTSPITGGGDLSANRTFAIPAATTSVNGYLTSTDWNTFNGKGSGTVTSIATTSPITGGTITGTGTIDFLHNVDLVMTVPQTITNTDGVFNNVAESQIALRALCTGAAANGIGAGVAFWTKDASSITNNVANIYGVTSDATHATLSAYIDFTVVNAGIAPASKMRLFGDGQLSVANTSDLGVPGVHARFLPMADSTTSATSWTPDSDTYDQEAQTALAGDVTINAPSGTPSDGKKLILRIKCNGSGHNITWNGAYVAMGVTLPTTISASKTIYAGCDYNSNTSKWDVLAVAIEP